MITTVKTTERISYAHRLQNHPGKCRFLHGHNSDVTVEITGEKDPETGMVVDFSDIKSVIEVYDHSTLLQLSDPLCEAIETIHLIHRFVNPPTAEVIAGFTNL